MNALHARTSMLLLLCLLLMPWLTLPTAGAQDGRNGIEDRSDPLALKERMIRERFTRFEDRIFRLREQLAEVEPDNAARLARVLERAGVMELSDRLDRIATLLDDPASRMAALDAQARWIQDADRLLTILFERRGDRDKLRRDVDRLQDYRENVERVLEQQEQAGGDSDGDSGGSRAKAPRSPMQQSQLPGGRPAAGPLAPARRVNHGSSDATASCCVGFGTILPRCSLVAHRAVALFLNNHTKAVPWYDVLRLRG